MSQNYILNRLMNDGIGQYGGCGCGNPTGSTAGTVGGCGCGNPTGSTASSVGGCPSCGSVGGCGCGSSGSFVGGASLKFLFFNKNDAENGVTDALETQHKGIMAHFEFVDVKGKTLKESVSTLEDLKNKISKAGVKAYIDEKVVYKKLNRRAFTGSENQKRVDLIDLKIEAAKMAVRQTVSDISKQANAIIGDVTKAADSFKKGLYTQGDDLVVTAAYELFKVLSNEGKQKLYNKLNVSPKTSVGGFTESFNDDEEFINSLFRFQNGGEVIDSDSQDGGAKTIAISSALKKDIGSLGVDISEINITKEKEFSDMKIPEIDSVLIFETRATGPAKIFGVCTNGANCKFL